MTAAQVRGASLEDAAGIAHAHILAWQQTYSHLVAAGELDDLSVARRTRRWEAILVDGRTRVWVAESDGEVVGFSSVGTPTGPDNPRPLELEAIYLVEAVHGSGLGQALLDAALGDEPAFLFVAAGNPRAIRFYERNRFAFDGASEQHRLVETPIRTLRMVR